MCSSDLIIWNRRKSLAGLGLGAVLRLCQYVPIPLGLSLPSLTMFQFPVSCPVVLPLLSCSRVTSRRVTSHQSRAASHQSQVISYCWSETRSRSVGRYHRHWNRILGLAVSMIPRRFGCWFPPGPRRTTARPQRNFPSEVQHLTRTPHVRTGVPSGSTPAAIPAIHRKRPPPNRTGRRHQSRDVKKPPARVSPAP